MESSDTCTACGGTGHTDSWCQKCGGRRRFPVDQDGPGPVSFYEFLGIMASFYDPLGFMVECGDCIQGKEKCSACGGTGRVCA